MVVLLGNAEIDIRASKEQVLSGSLELWQHKWGGGAGSSAQPGERGCEVIGLRRQGVGSHGGHGHEAAETLNYRSISVLYEDYGFQRV